MAVQVHTLIIGAGQAGLSTSYHLSRRGIEHLILERAPYVASSWREQRWDSFCLVTPNWMTKLPGFPYEGDAPNSFMSGGDIAAYLDRYAQRIDAPIAFNTRILELDHREGGGGFLVRTDQGTYESENVVVAAGFYGKARVPDFASSFPADMTQLTSAQYRKPEALPPGGVLVVGSGQSGAQIADELNRSGRSVYLSTGRAGRVPRRHCGEDTAGWLALAAGFDMGPFVDSADTLDSKTLWGERRSSKPHVTGKDGGRDLNLHEFARDGVRLLGRLGDVQDGKLALAPDLHENLRHADQMAYDLRTGLNDLVQEMGFGSFIEDPAPELEHVEGYRQHQVTEMDLRSEGITSVIWATGFRPDFNQWLRLPVFEDDGYPKQYRGVSEVPGLYFVGLFWMYTLVSDLLFGVGEDADYIARCIAGE